MHWERKSRRIVFKFNNIDYSYRIIHNKYGGDLHGKTTGENQYQRGGRRRAFLAEATAEYTGLREFSQYLTLLFEVDALFCNNDRHLNNIAVIEQSGRYDYCPIFDNGAGLLSNTQLSRMVVYPKALITVLRARPFNTTFTRQTNAARSFTGKQLILPKLSAADIQDAVQPLLEYYSDRDRGIIIDRVTACILIRQRVM